MFFTSAIVLIVLVQIWIVGPLLNPGFVGRSIPILLVLLLAAARQIVTHGRWGLDWRALIPASWRACAVTLPLVLLAAVVVALDLNDPPFHTPKDLALTFAFLFLWALGQQFALQTVIFEETRKTVRSGGKAVLVSGAIFAGLHLPNPFLTVATFVGGLVWCSIYRRSPNILPLAISHALGSMALIAIFNRGVTGGMRVGYAYLAFWLG